MMKALKEGLDALKKVHECFVASDDVPRRLSRSYMNGYVRNTGIDRPREEHQCR